MPTLQQNYHVASIEIFGSYAREQQSQKSDLDLLITFSEPYNLWTLLDVKEFLTTALRVKVDLVPKDSIKPILKEQILQEAIPIWETMLFSSKTSMTPIDEIEQFTKNLTEQTFTQNKRAARAIITDLIIIGKQ